LTRWERTGRTDFVTEGERLGARSARKAALGQYEAPGHGGTTGGFALVGGSD
jgi:hypothetical protein